MSTDKKISIKEFKTFIEACEFVTDSDEWIPSEKQWKRIRQMINNLEESGEYEKTKTPTPQVSPPQQFFQPPSSNPLESMNIDPSNIPVPSMPNITIPPAVIPPGRPFASNQGAVRTPDVDTSHGNYKSTFA